MKEWLSAAELAAEDLPGVPSNRTAVIRAAASGDWRSRPREGRGGGQEYHVSALPLTAQMVLAQRATRADTAMVTIPQPLKSRSKAVQPRAAAFSDLSESAQQICSARAAVALAYRQFRSANALLSDRTCRLAFERAWQSGEVFVEPEVRALIHGVSPNTVRAWQDKLSAGGLAALAPAYGNRAGSGLIDTDPDIRRLLLGILADKPHAEGQELMDALEARFPDRALPSRRTVQRWFQDWKAANAQLFLRITNPDAWRSKYKAASGNRSAGIVNPCDLWEADSTPADVLLADGKRHKIVGVIDVATRRHRLYVSRESNSTAIASTMRRAIMDWGVPTGLRIDNGSDYVSKHMWRVYDDLGIEVEVCPPFTPEAKPHVERAFRTFSHGLLEFLPGFIGHSVAERKDIEARRSFADRLMAQGEVIEIRQTPEELQSFCDQWCDNIYAHRPHGGLKGQTPFQAAAAYTGAVRRIENERALDILLSPTDGDGLRVVGKKGVRIKSGHYDAVELGGLEGQTVRVLFDEADAGAVWVFAEDGGFICRAIDPELLGASRAELAQARKARQAKIMRDGTAELKKAAREVRPQDLAGDILRDKAEKAGKLAALPSRTEAYTTPALDAAADASTPRRTPKQTVSEEMRAAVEHARQEAALQRESVVHSLPERSVMDEKRARFKRAQLVRFKLLDGAAVADEDAAWLARYETSAEYKAFIGLAEDPRGE